LDKSKKFKVEAYSSDLWLNVKSAPFLAIFVSIVDNISIYDIIWLEVPRGAILITKPAMANPRDGRRVPWKRNVAVQSVSNSVSTISTG
jgi:hypothetical protein